MWYDIMVKAALMPVCFVVAFLIVCFLLCCSFWANKDVYINSTCLWSCVLCTLAISILIAFLTDFQYVVEILLFTTSDWCRVHERFRLSASICLRSLRSMRLLHLYHSLLRQMAAQKNMMCRTHRVCLLTVTFRRFLVFRVWVLTF